jgi:MFS family permease
LPNDATDTTGAAGAAAAGASDAATGTRRVVLVLGSAQTLAWASSYYLPAIVAAPIARDLGLSVATVFLAFSVSLVLAALVGPASGRFIDRHGGRRLLIGTNWLFAAGLAALGGAEGPLSLFAAFALVGIAMGAGLYDAAFASLVWLYGRGSRNPITGITLLAGFASTVGWPLTAWMSEQWGWRGACAGWAALHLVLGLPLNAWLPRRRQPAALPPLPAAGEGRGEGDDEATGVVAAAGPTSPSPSPDPAGEGAMHGAGEAAAVHWTPLVLLAFVLATTRFVATGIGAHLPGLLMAAGASLAAAVAVGTLVGPAQVGGRLLEFGLLRRWHPLWSARLAALAPPLGMGALLAFGLPAAAPFALLHGAGNGIITIAKGTLPLALFGAQGYGRRQGWLALPAQALQAFAPWLFGLALQHSSRTLMALSCAISAAGWLALMSLRLPAPAGAAASGAQR